MPRWAPRADANQPQVVEALRRMGASVQHLHMVGKGCPDLAVGIKGHSLMVEIKDGAKKPSARKLTPDEEEWHAAWRGSLITVYGEEDAISKVLLFVNHLSTCENHAVQIPLKGTIR